jgi:hypothetical protein
MQDTDRNWHSVADAKGVQLYDLRLDPTDEGHGADEFDDTLKFSNAQYCVALRLWIRGGSENAVDMNRDCKGIRIQDSTLISGAQCAIVIKGGARDIELSHVCIVPRNRETPCDIELGGWSDQSDAPTRRVTLHEVSRIDGMPVRVAVGHAERPTIIRGRVRVLFWRSLGLKVFVYTRFLARRTGAMLRRARNRN